MYCLIAIVNVHTFTCITNDTKFIDRFIWSESDLYFVTTVGLLIHNIVLAKHFEFKIYVLCSNLYPAHIYLHTNILYFKPQEKVFYMLLQPMFYRFLAARLHTQTTRVVLLLRVSHPIIASF